MIVNVRKIHKRILECELLAYRLSRRYKSIISIDRFSMKWSIDASDTPLRFALRCYNDGTWLAAC